MRETQWQKILLTGLFSILVFVGIGIGIGIFTKKPAQATTAVPAGGSAMQTITVQGVAEKFGKPSIARINIGVITQGATLKEAQELNTPKVDAVLAELKAQGIEEKDIQTDGYYVNPRYDPETWSKVIGYEVNHGLRVTIRNIDNAGTVLDAVIAKGANTSQGITFDLTEEEKDTLYKEAMKDAVTHGEGNAKVLAEAIGKSIGEPLRIIEGGAPNVEPLYEYAKGRDMAATEASAATSFSPGQLSVRATVTLMYETK